MATVKIRSKSDVHFSPSTFFMFDKNGSFISYKIKLRIFPKSVGRVASWNTGFIKYTNIEHGWFKVYNFSVDFRCWSKDFAEVGLVVEVKEDIVKRVQHK